MSNMQNYDLTSESGRQEFQRWIIELIRNEINSYAKEATNRGPIKIDTTLTTAQRVSNLESIIMKGG